MIQSCHTYPLFSDLIEAQKKSVLSFLEKGIVEEFELFSYISSPIIGSSRKTDSRSLKLSEEVDAERDADRDNAMGPSPDDISKDGAAALRVAPSRTGREQPARPDLAATSNLETQSSSMKERGRAEGNLNSMSVSVPRDHLFMIFHGSKFFLQKPLASFEKILEAQKTYSVSLFLPVEFQVSESCSRITGAQSSSDERSQGHEAAGSGRGVAGRSHPYAAGYGREALSRSHALSSASRPSLRKKFPGGKPQVLYFGEIPLMTERGNFLINGSSRVLVNQIVRCPNFYLKARIDQKNRRTFIGSFLSEYGSWLRLETDYKNRIWVRIDRYQRFSIYILLRALGFPEHFLKYQLGKANYGFLLPSRSEGSLQERSGIAGYPLDPHEAVQMIWKKCTPNRWNSLEGCYTFFYTKFFHPKKYSLGSVGRDRLNKRFGGQDAKRDLSNKNLVPTLIPEDIFQALHLLIKCHYGEASVDDIDHLKNRRIRLSGELMQNQFRLALSRVSQSASERLSKIKEEHFRLRNEGREARYERGQPASRSASRPLEGEAARDLRYSDRSGATQPARDASRYLAAPPDLTDHLGHTISAAHFIQTQIFSSTFRELFNTSQLSQYMDQTNPLAEMTHKRRLSSLGPGGIAKDQAGVAVREIHPSHFGRICPIETPEGQNAGLVGSLATYCRITSEGYLLSAYQKPITSRLGTTTEPRAIKIRHSRLPSTARDLGKPFPSSHPDRSGIAGEWFFFDADIEDELFISAEAEKADPAGYLAPMEAPMEASMEESVTRFGLGREARDAGGRSRARSFDQENTPPLAILPASRSASRPHEGTTQPATDAPRYLAAPRDLYPVRYRQEFFRVSKKNVDFFGVSPIQMISVATSLIPFLEHDDANRALMGSNMQRQAVPLLFRERPLIGTGLEQHGARDSTTLCVSPKSGQIVSLDSQSVSIHSRNSITRSRNSAGQRSAAGYGREAQSRSGIAGCPRPEPAAQSPASRSEIARSVRSRLRPLEGEAARDLIGSQKIDLSIQKHWRSNQNTCIFQTPDVRCEEWVEKGDLLANGAGSHYGEIALGKNILVAYLPWEGYNFEDAIVINERLVKENIYTSIHIERYDIDTKETSYGKERIGLLAGREAHYGQDAKRASRSASRPLEGEAARDLDPAEPAVLPILQDKDLRAGSAGSSHALDSHGIVIPGSWVEENDLLVSKSTPIAPQKPTPEYRLLLAIFETKPLPFRDTSLRVPSGIQGRVLECIIWSSGLRISPASRSASLPATPDLPLEDTTQPASRSASRTLEGEAARYLAATRYSPAVPGTAVIDSVQVFIASQRKIQLGDKMSGRHGNKGIVSLILPQQDMPFLPDGTSVDIVLNPLGVPSRMNVGQVLESLFGLAARALHQVYRLMPFDEVYGPEASRGLVYQKLFEASTLTGFDWLFDPNHPGKTHLFDGRTGENFHQPILVGCSYMLKLIHQVDEKMHARSTGPYSLITQQPLGGRSKHGGQRLGEMEVWALEGFGSSSILHEFLTLKSDDIDSRNTFLFSLMKRKSKKIPTLTAPTSRTAARSDVAGCVAPSTARDPGQPAMDAERNLDALLLSVAQPATDASRYLAPTSSQFRTPNNSEREATVPESFRVLVHELQALCLSVYFNPEFRLTYPSLLGWDGFFFLSSK